MTKDNFFQEHMGRLANSILAQAERARAGAGHSGIKGTSIEVILRRVLQQYLPSAFAVGTGQVASGEGSFSAQTDILIYSGAIFPHLSCNEDGSVVICCESVLAAVECKTAWDAKDIANNFRRFCLVDTARFGWYSQKDMFAGYFVVVLEKVRNPYLIPLKDANRFVGVYSLEAERSWCSQYGREGFIHNDGNALNLFLSHILQDCMRKGPGELGTLEETYKVVARYLGWR